MNPRPKYKTKQKELLMECFKSHPGVHLTAAEVVSYLKERDCSIGQSTVYRQLELMVSDGIINKYVLDSTSPACFEYVGAESHHHDCECFHLKCQDCGKLIHLHCHEIEELESHLMGEHQFSLDPRRTVFYGRCKECSDKHIEIR